MELNPNYPAVYLGNLGFAYRLAGCIEEAIATFKAYDARIPGKGFGLADLVICMNRTAGRTRLVRPQRVSWRPARTSRSQRGQEPRLSGKEGASTPTWPRYEPLGFLKVERQRRASPFRFQPGLTARSLGSRARTARQPNRGRPSLTTMNRGRDAQNSGGLGAWVGPRRARPMAFSVLGQREGRRPAPAEVPVGRALQHKSDRPNGHDVFALARRIEFAAQLPI